MLHGNKRSRRRIFSPLGERPAAQFYLLLGRGVPNSVTVIAEELDLALIKLVVQDLLRKDEFQMMSTRTGGFVGDEFLAKGWTFPHEASIA